MFGLKRVKETKSLQEFERPGKPRVLVAKYALKGQKTIAQGRAERSEAAPWVGVADYVRPVRAKDFLLKLQLCSYLFLLMLLPLQGALFGPRLPQGAVRYAHSALGYGLVGLSGRSWPLIPPIVPTLQAGF